MAHRFNEHELGQSLGDGEEQGSLTCCNHGIARSRTWLGDGTTTTVEREPGSWFKDCLKYRETCGEQIVVEVKLNNCL